MASTAARHCPGGKAVFIRGIRLVRLSRPAADPSPARFGAEWRAWGFSASAGMAQAVPNFCAPGMRPAVHSCCTVRTERFHFSAVSRTVRYSMAVPPAIMFQPLL